MKLNHECVRDVLLFLEAEPYVTINSDGDVEYVGIWFTAICKAMPQYSADVIFYTLSKLEEADFLDLSVQWANGCLLECCVNYITYEGHEFLDRIRPDSVWKKTTSIAGKIGSFGLQMISKIAEGVTTAYIKELILSN